jgi:hypothetical protein
MDLLSSNRLPAGSKRFGVAKKNNIVPSKAVKIEYRRVTGVQDGLRRGEEARVKCKGSRRSGEALYEESSDRLCVPGIRSYICTGDPE